MNRAELIKKLEVLIADPAAPLGEKEAAQARLAAIKSKHVSMSDTEIYAVTDMLIVDVAQIGRKLQEKNEELRVFRPEAKKRYRACLKAMTDKEVLAEWRSVERESWKKILCRDEYIARFKKRLRHMSDDELKVEKLKPLTFPYDTFVAREIERRRWRR
jgi:hypothetical protein